MVAFALKGDIGHEKIVHLDNPFAKPYVLEMMPRDYGYDLKFDGTICDALMNKCEKVHKVCR